MSKALETARKVKPLKNQIKGIYQVNKIMNESKNLSSKEKEAWGIVSKVLIDRKKVNEQIIRKLTK